MNSSSETTKGGQANLTGNRLERFVEAALIDGGYTHFIGPRKTAFANRKAIGGKQYIKQLPVGDTIYLTTRKVDFYVINRAKFPDDLIIECKWQQIGGSVDEKYPFLLLNIMRTGIPTVILLDGGGYKQAAMDWLKGEVRSTSALIAVWNMAEFHREVNKGFLG